MNKMFVHFNNIQSKAVRYHHFRFCDVIFFAIIIWISISPCSLQDILQNEIKKAVLRFFSSTALLFLIFLFYCLAYAYSVSATSPDKASLGDCHLPSANLSSSLLKMQSAITRPVKATNTALVSSNSVTNVPNAAPPIKQRIMP